VLHTFIETQNIIRGNRNAWAFNTQLWPTILLLTNSSISLTFDLAIVGAYFIAVKQANKISAKFGTEIALLDMLSHLVVWLATAIAYRIGRDGHDLWGWSCSGSAQNIQAMFPEVDFGFFCDLQVGV
jgi:hypothetical protein